jgi:ATP-dependent DNA ligase
MSALPPKADLRGLEGIVSKKLDAPYWSGPSKAWLKIKSQHYKWGRDTVPLWRAGPRGTVMDVFALAVWRF